MNKKELRAYIRQQKRHFTQQQLGEMSLRVMTALLAHPKVLAADTILMYHSLPDEVDTHDTLDILVSMGKKVLLPKVISNTEMTIHEYTGRDSIVASPPYGILEPITPAISDMELFGCCSSFLTPHSSLIIIPGMAFDSACHRLGRGKGYYDRFLSRVPNIYKIGVCFPFQFVDSVPSEPTDILMNEVLC